MEKFGIFELLDTLSALILPEAGPPSPDPGPNAADGAFAPPAYKAPSKTTPEQSAISAFLDRHDRAVKQIGSADGGGSADAKAPKP